MRGLRHRRQLFDGHLGRPTRDGFTFEHVCSVDIRLSASWAKLPFAGFGDGRLDRPKVTGLASELSRYLGPTSAA